MRQKRENIAIYMYELQYDLVDRKRNAKNDKEKEMQKNKRDKEKKKDYFFGGAGSSLQKQK